MKVFDLFPFFNELALLELRVAELGPVVTRFGMVELPVTFTDKPKPLYYSELPHHKQHKDIFIHVPPTYPSGPHPTVDWFQRGQLWRLAAGAFPDDVIMLSDVDEIPDRTFVQKYIDDDVQHPMTFKMKLFYHRVDLMDRAPWLGTVICRRKNLGREPNMQELREHRSTFPQIDGGWHFSWLGDAKAIATKLEAVDILRENAIYGAAGIEPPDEDPAFLQSCYETGVDLFGRKDRPKTRVPIVPGVNQPHEIVAWLEKYPQYAAVDTVPY
jgi:Glycosyltransferase family 17.